MQFHERSRVKVFSAPTHGKMQMRRCRAAGSPAKRNKLTGAHLLAFFYLELGKMHVDCNQSLAMIQHHAVSFEIKRPRQNHCSRIGCVNRRPGAHAEIETLMLALLLSIDDPRGPKNPGSLDRKSVV